MSMEKENNDPLIYGLDLRVRKAPTPSQDQASGGRPLHVRNPEFTSTSPSASDVRNYNPPDPPSDSIRDSRGMKRERSPDLFYPQVQGQHGEPSPPPTGSLDQGQGPLQGAHRLGAANQAQHLPRVGLQTQTQPRLAGPCHL